VESGDGHRGRRAKVRRKVLKSKVIHEYLKSPKATADNVPRRHAGKSARNGASPALVVAALAPMLRGQPGRNLGDNDDTTRHLSGRSVRVLAFRRRARRY
jgi:hypothetical protein